MNRALLSNGRNFNAAHRLTLASGIGGDTFTWFNNITSTVALAGLILNKGVPDNQKLTMATHIYETPAWQPIANQLARLGICTLAEIQGPTGQLTTQSKNHLPQFPPFPLPLDTAATTLLPKIFWMPYERTERGAVFEIVSSTPTATLYRKWYPTEPDMRLEPGRRICWTPSDYRNPPSQYSLLTDGERTVLTTRILVNPLRKYIGWAKSRTIVAMFATTPPVFMTPIVTQEQRDQIGPLEEEIQHAILVVLCGE
jgi:hypothetical protein